MNELVKQVEALKKGPVKGLVDARMAQFKALGSNSSEERFKELCFCTLTANFDAAKSIRVQERVCDGFLRLAPKKLEARLRELGYRYPNRAAYIAENRKCASGLGKILESLPAEKEKREWLAENIKGLGFKEASHFLRNIGFENLAIVDFHIVDLLVRNGLIERPKTMTRKKYLEIEEVLAGLARRLRLSLAELDLYLWYLETGKVLK